jgi:class 3 adenylate cyclase
VIGFKRGQRGNHHIGLRDRRAGAADAVGYSRLAEANEDRTLTRLRCLRRYLIDPAIEAHQRRIVKRTGPICSETLSDCRAASREDSPLKG